MNFLKRNKEIVIFAIFELIALILNLILTGKSNVISCRCIIYANLLFAILFTVFKNKKSFVVYALIFTAISDTLLVSTKTVSEAARIIALVSFIVVQIIYLLELFKENKKITVYLLLCDLILSVLISVVSIFLFKSQYNALIPLTIIYFVILLFNLINTCINFKKESNMFFGFLFFIMCDILVGLSTGVSLGILPANNEFVNFVLKLAKYEWTPYILAQFFLVSSIISKDFKHLVIIKENY